MYFAFVSAESDDLVVLFSSAETRQIYQCCAAARDNVLTDWVIDTIAFPTFEDGD